MAATAAAVTVATLSVHRLTPCSSSFRKVGEGPRAEPLAFGTPVPAAYGVHSDSHRTAPVGGVNTLLTSNVALFSCAPNGERPGEPCGVSEGPRQTVSLAAPRPDSTLAVGFTYTGR